MKEMKAAKKRATLPRHDDFGSPPSFVIELGCSFLPCSSTIYICLSGSSPPFFVHLLPSLLQAHFPSGAYDHS